MSSSSSSSIAPKTPYKQIRALLEQGSGPDVNSQTITVYQAYNRAIAEAAVSAQKLNASPKFRVGSRMTWIKPSWGWMLYRSGYSYKDAGQERILAIKMRLDDFWGLLRSAELTTTSEGRSFGGTRMEFLAEGTETGSNAAATGEGNGSGEGVDTNKLEGENEEEDCSRDDMNPADRGKEGTDKVARPGRGKAANRRDKRRFKEEQQKASGGGTGKSKKVKVQWDPERSIRLKRLDYRSIQIGIPGCLTERWCEEMIVGIEDVTENARELKRILDLEGEDRWDRTELKELVAKGLVPVEKEVQVPDDIRVLLRMDLPGSDGKADESSTNV